MEKEAPKGKNSVFIATSLDGYIADRNGKIDWLHNFPNPENIDMGYGHFMKDIDAIIMGRKTFETVLSFGIDWPYKKPVFVLSQRLDAVPKELKGKVQILKGSPQEILKEVDDKGLHRRYIDGGTTIQSFLKEGLIDSLTITTIPILLGAGIPLFGNLSKPQNFHCVQSQIFLEAINQSTYIRRNDD